MARIVRIAKVRYCKECPHFNYVFKRNWMDTDDYHCGALDRWVYGRVYSFHEDCPLEIAKDDEVEVPEVVEVKEVDNG